MPSSWLLITNATVVDGAGNPPMPGTSVLVKDGRISAVGTQVSRDLVPRGEDLTEIDATGKTRDAGPDRRALPHDLRREPHRGGDRPLHESASCAPSRPRSTPRRCCAPGVTGISQPGGSYYIGVGLREAIKDGIVQGPRMTAAGRYLTTSNGLTDWFPDSVGVPEGSIGIVHNTLDKMIDRGPAPGEERRRPHQAGRQPVRRLPGVHQRRDEGAGRPGPSAGQEDDHPRPRVGRGRRRGQRRHRLDHARQHHDRRDHRPTWPQSGTPLVPTLLLLANVGDWGHLVGAPAADARRHEGDARQVGRRAAPGPRTPA